MFLWTAFLVGIVGSLHCVGMCGPIAAILPYQGASKIGTAANVLKYHAGRILTYSILGAMIGLVGRGIYIAGWQSTLSIIAGIFLLVLAVFSVRVERKFIRLPGVSRLFGFVRAQLAEFLHQKHQRHFIFIGMLNGLLPCGMVYLAITGALATGSVWQGAVYMSLFGAGTIPLLLLVSVFGNWVGMKVRNVMRRAIPGFLVLFALLLIFRGVNFDLPSTFSFWEATAHQPMCH